jgi:hypothetical protein
MKALSFFSWLFAAVLFVDTAAATTIFPIATNSSITYLPGGIVTSGSNYLVGIVQNQTNPCIQLLSTNGALIGSLLSMGSSQGAPLVAFGKTNYLAFWAGDNVYGQFISLDGTLVGSPFQLPPSAGTAAESAVAFDGTNFLVVWQDDGSLDVNGNNAFYGQLVTPTGTLLGSDFFIGSILASIQSYRDTHAALAFGNTNYLFAWPETNSLSGGWNAYGVFVSRNGSVGTSFQISQIASLDYLPPVVAFDGTNFFVVINTDTNRTASGAPIWNMYGRLISQSGTFPTSELLLNTNQSTANSLAFDGTNYLLSWGFNTYSTNMIKNNFFQFFNRLGSAIGPIFSPFQAQGTNTPLFGGVVYDGRKFAIGSALGSLSVGTVGNITGLNSGAIYGAFIPASTASPTLMASNLFGIQFPLQLTGTPGINYAILVSTNLAAGNWTSVVTNSPTNGTFSFIDTGATNSSRFYRALKQ